MLIKQGYLYKLKCRTIIGRMGGSNHICGTENFLLRRCYGNASDNKRQQTAMKGEVTYQIIDCDLDPAKKI